MADILEAYLAAQAPRLRLVRECRIVARRRGLRTDSDIPSPDSVTRVFKFRTVTDSGIPD